MNSSVTRTELLAFWNWIEVQASPFSDMSQPASPRAYALRSSFALHSMNSSMSGWSALRMTILAARRVLPPDLIEPAMASAPRMKETGPEARPPVESGSREERSRDRLTPEPEPPLKIIPSVRHQSRIDSIVSSTERMKQAEHCGFSSTPTLNQTGLLKETFWCRSRCVSSSAKASRLLVVGEVAVLAAPVRDRAHHAVDELADAALALDLALLVVDDGAASGPRKYLETTTFVAVCDQSCGHLHVLLLEDGLAVLGDDGGAARLPLHLVVGVRLPVRQAW